MADTKEWTLMFYFASDNPLAPSIVSQLKAIKDAGFHQEANVVARFDPRTVGEPAHIFEVNLINKLKARGRSLVGFTANDPFVRNLVLDRLWEEGNEDIVNRIRESLERKNGGAEHNDRDGFGVEERDAGDQDIDFKPPTLPRDITGEQPPKESLQSFIEFSLKNFPARHYMLFILGHGIVVGNDIFLFDEHTSPDEDDLAPHSLTLKGLAGVLNKFFKKADGGRSQLELIGFHSCSVSALEVAYELKDTANYMMASQGPAFVGSWPYRQILIRIFNDLNLPLRPADLLEATDLIAKLKEGSPLFARLSGDVQQLLSEHNGSQSLDDKFLEKIVSGLNRVLDDPTLSEAELVEQGSLSKATGQLLEERRSGRQPLRPADLRRLNRLLLADAFPGQIAVNPKMNEEDIKWELIRIFYYILYNSYDFQLAGYSFDLTLCDLNKVKDIKKPLGDLAKALLDGLGDEVTKGIILLAHWDAQSYWQENYTDIYDFCFRFEKRREMIHPAPDNGKLDAISGACGEIMRRLKRGSRGDDKGIIVRSEFAGPEFQYSHGFSVFFPWSLPPDGFFSKTYKGYNINAPGAGEEKVWSDFLDGYFDLTMRKPRTDPKEFDANDPVGAPADGSDAQILELLQLISNQVFNADGQLAKGGSDDKTGGPGKAGSTDPTGDDCDCPSVKNYPHFTRAPGGGKDGDVPLGPNFAEQQRIR